MNSREIPGHRPSVLGQPAGVYRPVSQGLPVVPLEKLTEKKAFVVGHWPGVRDTRPSSGFSDILCDFFLMCHFCSLNPNLLNKESRPFFLGENRMWRFLSVCSLRD